MGVPLRATTHDARAQPPLAPAVSATPPSEREHEVRAELIDGLAPFRTADGSYRLDNTWHFLIANALRRRPLALVLDDVDDPHGASRSATVRRAASSIWMRGCSGGPAWYVP